MVGNVARQFLQGAISLKLNHRGLLNNQYQFEFPIKDSPKLKVSMGTLDPLCSTRRV